MNIVCLHGAGETCDVWRPLAATIPGIRCLDLPGHGVSRGHGRSSIADYAEWVDQRMQGSPPVVLAGHSMGGAIALELALRAPRRPWLSALILIGTGARLRVRRDLIELLTTDFDAAVDSIISQSISAQNLRDVGPLLEQCLRRVGAEVIRDDLLACNGFDAMKRLPEVTVPSLVIVGADDRMTPVKFSEYLWHNLPESTYSVIPSAGHLVMCERTTDVLGPITSFMTDVRSHERFNS